MRSFLAFLRSLAFIYLVTLHIRLFIHLVLYTIQTLSDFYLKGLQNPPAQYKEEITPLSAKLCREICSCYHWKRSKQRRGFSLIIIEQDCEHFI